MLARAVQPNAPQRERGATVRERERRATDRLQYNLMYYTIIYYV